MYEPESDRAHGFPRIAGHAAQSADNGPGRKCFLIDTGDTFDGVDGGYPGGSSFVGGERHGCHLPDIRCHLR